MAEITNEVLQLAEILWNYHHVNHELKTSDLIIGLGSHDLRVAEYTAQLFLQNLAPLIIFTGGQDPHKGDIAGTGWKKTEAEMFKNIAVEKGVPEEKIILENLATNTELNARYSESIIQDKALKAEQIIVVTKPYMERRAYVTFKNFWQNKNTNIIITSPKLSFLEYLTDDKDYQEKAINIMVGDLQRIRDYPAKGFQIYQGIPDNVMEAFNKLVELGYDKHLIK
jgi:uncharacterized SAM-binding protein YcdF (DUF218 family)